MQIFLTACSAVKLPVTNQYQLSAFSNKKLVNRLAQKTILVSYPEAVAGYQTGQMLYIKKPFELSAFANNAWVDQPANMIFPLIVQSLQCSGYFYAVASSPHAEETDYRLDTQLIELQQNFLKKPSVIDVVVKIVLTQTRDNRVVASRLIHQQAICPTDTPYGGVIAANRAIQKVTAEITQFVVSQVRRDTRYHH